MALEGALRRFPEQFDWMPQVVNGELLGTHPRFVVCGMGGSHLGAWLIKKYGKYPNIVIHRDYGLPATPDGFMQDALVILSSYSGNTEETLDAGREALERGFAVAAISTGGALIEFAQKHRLPHVQIPQTGIQPRTAIGFSMLGIAKLMQNAQLEKDIRESGKRVEPLAGREEGKRIADLLAGKIPLIYSSAANIPIAYMWKIKLNETSKIPAFCNQFPELCHNELTGFDVVDSTREVSKNMYALFLEDFSDHPRVQKRMEVAAELLNERGIPVEKIPLAGKTGFEKALNAALLADWTALNIAARYGVDDEQVPMVEDFKKRIA